VFIVTGEAIGWTGCTGIDCAAIPICEFGSVFAIGVDTTLVVSFIGVAELFAGISNLGIEHIPFFF
jgi:hypothetical protein